MGRDGDQDSNDLDKCLQATKERWQLQQNSHIDPATPRAASVVVLGAFGGRFDQEVAAVHALYAWRGAFHRVILVGGGNIAELLGPGALRPCQGKVAACVLTFPPRRARHLAGGRR